jgi:DNA-binding transcriptional ArsR family regulator
MKPPEGTDLAETHEKVEIVSTDDEKIKLIGSLLSNDASRNILKLLFEQEMTANEIAQKTGMLLSLIIFHLQKMQEVGLVKINKVGKNSKGHDMKYYGTTKLAVIILPPKISEKAKKSKSLANTLNRIYKFAAIATAGVVAWLVLNINVNPVSPGLVSRNPDAMPIGIIIPLLIVIVGLVMERIIEFRK